MTAVLSPRQIAICNAEQRGPRRKRDETPFDRAQLDAFLAECNPKGWAALNAKPKPLSARTQQRLNKIREVCATLDKQALQQRIKKVLAFDVSRYASRAPEKTPTQAAPPVAPAEPANVVDAVIAKRVAEQPEKHRTALNSLYSAWCAFDAAYFGSRLSLPIIRIEKIGPHTMANCTIDKLPCIIRFSPLTLKRDKSQVFDVLLHEMIHQAIAQLAGTAAAHCDKTGGHNAEFARIANQIGKERGWSDCYENHHHGARSARHWPARCQ